MPYIPTLHLFTFTNVVAMGGLFSQAGKCHLMPSPSCLSVHVSSPVPLVVFCACNLCSYTRPPSTSAVLVQRSSSNRPVTVLCKWAPPLLLPPLQWCSMQCCQQSACQGSESCSVVSLLELACRMPHSIVLLSKLSISSIYNYNNCSTVNLVCDI